MDDLVRKIGTKRLSQPDSALYNKLCNKSAEVRLEYQRFDFSFRKLIYCSIHNPEILSQSVVSQSTVTCKKDATL